MGLIASTLHQIAQSIQDIATPHRASNAPSQGNRNVNDDKKVPEYPCLLIPGIAGTILHSKQLPAPGKVANSSQKSQGGQASDVSMAVGDKVDEGARVWVTVIGAETKFQKLFCRYNTKSNLVEQIHPDTEVIVPTGNLDDGGLYPVECLDPDLYIPINVVKYFYELILTLKGEGYVPNQSLFGFGYDFRQSNEVHVEDLLAKIKSISEKNGNKKVDLISHSMGGLVVQSFLSLYKDQFEKYVNKWVAIACPFQGAAGYTMDSLLSGCGFGQGWEEYLVRYLYVHRHSFQQVLCESPSLYQLLPSTSFDWSKVGQQEPSISIYLQKTQPPSLQTRYTHTSIHSPQSIHNMQQSQIQQAYQQNYKQLYQDGKALAYKPNYISPQKQGDVQLNEQIEASNMLNASTQAQEFLNPISTSNNPRDYSVPDKNGAVTRRFVKHSQQPKPRNLYQQNNLITNEQRVDILSNFMDVSDMQSGSKSYDGFKIWPWPDNKKKEEGDDDKDKVYVLECKISQFRELMEKVLVDHTVKENSTGALVPIQVNPGCFESAQNFLKLRSGVQIPASCKFYSIYGIGQDTPYSVQYGSPETPLDKVTSVYTAGAVYVCIEGDGTVPLYSSLGDGFNNVIERKAFKGNHRGLLSDKDVLQQVIQYLSSKDQKVKTQKENDWVIL